MKRVELWKSEPAQTAGDISEAKHAEPAGSQWWFHVKEMGNGEVLDHSEGYHNMRDAVERAIDLFPDLGVVQLDGPGGEVFAVLRENPVES